MRASRIAYDSSERAAGDAVLRRLWADLPTARRTGPEYDSDGHPHRALT